MRAYPSEQTAEWESSRSGAFARRGQHCSGLVKHVPAARDIVTGHTTFNDYQFMLRVYKTYDFSGGKQVQGTAQYPGSRVSFSSRPADLHSKDDFYAVGSGLTVIETSLTVFNKDTYQKLTPASVPCWARVQVANRASSSSQQWTDLFSKHNSGTHNNQWIVTDYKQLPPRLATAGSPSAELPDGTAWMLEQMPGLVVARDATADLRATTYLYSINIPKFPEIFNYSGYNHTGFNYSTDVRARMFGRDQRSISDLLSASRVMNQNNYTTDPLALDKPCNAISARCDLPGNITGHPYAFGGIDAKLIDRAGMLDDPSLPVRAISGPTHQVQKPFSFLPEYADIPHEGMPNTWDFDWLQVEARPVAQ